MDHRRNLMGNIGTNGIRLVLDFNRFLTPSKLMERCLVPIGVALSDGYENWVWSSIDFMNSAGAVASPKKSSITGGYSHRYLLMQRALMSCSIGKSTQLTCFLCRVNTYWQSVLALAMDRLIRVSMKNAASCVIYHEFGEVLNAQRRWVFPSARLAQGCLISESVESSLNESSVILTTLRRAVYC
uniref:Transposase n=1 Tax=Heterorhabditis bacteriophora TaxID=37862 RepID=A0A1I7WKS3_HETBA